MPYASDAQRRYFNAQRGKDIPADVVDEFNEASRGMKLPEKIGKVKKKKNKLKKIGKAMGGGGMSGMTTSLGMGGDFTHNATGGVLAGMSPRKIGRTKKRKKK